MPETGAAIAAWWEGAGAAAAAGEAAGGAAALGEGVGAGLGAEAAGAGLEAGLGTGLMDSGVAAAGDVAPAATEGIIPNSGPASTSLAETPAATPTQTSAKSLIEGTAGPTPTPSPADAAQYGLQPGQYIDPATGSIVTPGPGTQPGIIDRILSGADRFATDHPIIAGQTVSGVGKAALGTLTASQKRKADLEALAVKHGYDIDLAGFKQRQTQSNPSVGGGGVNLNLRPGSDVLLRPGGAPVFVPGSGIINRNIGT